MGTLAGWSKRQKLTIDHSKIDDDLTDFPVKVIVPSDNPIFNTAKSDGADVRFTAADGETLLKFEREVHDTTEKIAVYHVKIPSVSSTSDTDFYLYYGNASASDASSPNDVWDSNYKLVLHMGPSLEDSTSNGNDGTNYGTTLGLASDGYYRSFDGVNDYIVIPRVVSSDFSLLGSFSTKQNLSSVTERKWYHGAGIIDAEVATVVNDFGMSIYSGGFILAGTGNPDTFLETGGGYNDGNTHIATFTRTRSNGNLRLYADGELEDTNTGGTQDLTSPPRITIGCLQTGINFFNGTISEVRISSIARSDAWIKATSASLHDDLLTFGDEEPAVTMMLAFNF